MTLSKAHCLCVPSQNGLLADCPQRQSDTLVRPPSPKTRPCESTISKSPSTLMDPLSRIMILVAAIFQPLKEPSTSLFCLRLVFRNRRVYFIRPRQNSAFQIPDFAESRFT